MAARLARALVPPQAPDLPPGWLRPDQRLSFGRALGAIRRYSGALLADQPGTGKTWIGLAAVSALQPGHPIHVLAPATLRSQWTRVANRTGLEIHFHSHEQLSRGKSPPATPGPVIIDESHRMRNPATRRYLTLAPWCIGRQGLLLSATPTVNRFEDVVHQLLLFIRDDALAWSGVSSLLRSDPVELSGELARLIVTGEDRSGQLPEKESTAVRVEDTSGWFNSTLAGLMALRLSRDPAIAGLIRVSLLGTLGSSPLALAEALGRYRSLLLHARDAERSGKVLSRRTIRQFTGAELDQMVFWSLVAEPSQGVELALEDLDMVQELESAAKRQVTAPDPKARRLAAVNVDRRRTLVFTNARATVRYLRSHLGSGIAWCTGERSGIDGLEVPRDDVLDLFRTPESSKEPIPRPRVLLATDVAAEGLDLPQVARVVHYDLPWTAVRLEQRTGRAFRLESHQASVEVIRFLPPLVLEATLRREEILARKETLPDRLGLSDTGDASWRLRARIASAWTDWPSEEGTAVVRESGTGFIGCVRIRFSDGVSEDFILARRNGESLRETIAIAGLLERGRSGSGDRGPNPRAVSAAVAHIATATRQRLRALRSGALVPARRTPGLAALRRHLAELGRDASRRRDHQSLTLVQRGVQWLRRGHTAGESLRIQQWSRLSAPELGRALSSLSNPSATPTVASVELAALLVISPKEAPR